MNKAYSIPARPHTRTFSLAHDASNLIRAWKFDCGALLNIHVLFDPSYQYQQVNIITVKSQSAIEPIVWNGVNGVEGPARGNYVA